MRRVRDEQVNALMALAIAGLGLVGLFATVRFVQQSFEPGLNRAIVFWPAIPLVLAFDLLCVVRAGRSGGYLEPGQSLICRGLPSDRTVPLTGEVSFEAVYVAAWRIPPGLSCTRGSRSSCGVS